MTNMIVKQIDSENTMTITVIDDDDGNSHDNNGNDDDNPKRDS